MELMETINSRRSIRKYLDKPVEPDKIEAVLKAGQLAHSASNRQEWRFVVVTQPETREKIAEIAGQPFVGEAGAIIVACGIGTHRMRCGLECMPIDVAIALTHMTFKAVEEGLGTCWIGSFDADKIKELLHIPDEAVVVELMPIGYPASSPQPKPRKSLEEIRCFEKWGFGISK